MRGLLGWLRNAFISSLAEGAQVKRRSTVGVHLPGSWGQVKDEVGTELRTE